MLEYRYYIKQLDNQLVRTRNKRYFFMIYYEEKVKYIEKRCPELTGKLHDFWGKNQLFFICYFLWFISKKNRRNNINFMTYKK